ncbi:hypothetical protein SB6421_05089 [Klebsiella huaxiensis]|nr:hypothetical protein SB6421_05089 [Klebsiella huaxiensis]
METGLLIFPFALCLDACSLELPLFIQQRNPRRQCQMGLIAGISGALIAAAALHVKGFYSCADGLRALFDRRRNG